MIKGDEVHFLFVDLYLSCCERILEGVLSHDLALVVISNSLNHVLYIKELEIVIYSAYKICCKGRDFLDYSAASCYFDLITAGSIHCQILEPVGDHL